MNIPSNIIDITGQKFGKLTVLEFSHIEQRNARWKCQCDCENKTILTVNGRSLRNGHTKSCGCYHKERVSETFRIPHKIIDGIECKWCCECEGWLELSGFPRDKNSADGLNHWCKNCSSEYNKLHRKERNKYQNTRYKNDINFRLANDLRNRIRAVLKDNSKSAHTLELLGCSIDDFKHYIENQFTPEMTWDNQGSYWHIDHIKPCAMFDLSKYDSQRECFHYSNMQPLEAHENLSKYSIYDGVMYRRKSL